MPGDPVVGILLAAGSASRFGGEKLMAALPDGRPVGIAALENLAAAVDAVVVVVRPHDAVLAAAFAARGARVTACPQAAEGMGVSLAWGIRAAPVAAGWVIALADMPWVQSATISGVVAALRRGAAVAAPQRQGKRGHPVGFAADRYPELIALSGDEGAKPVVAQHRVTLIDTEDAGILLDVDTRQDLDG
jgi:molybdenum cofactor cytidylyltransferase